MIVFQNFCKENYDKVKAIGDNMLIRIERVKNSIICVI